MRRIVPVCIILVFAKWNVTARAASYPPETTYDGSKNIPSLAQPAYLQSITEPVFGTTLTRISDISLGNSNLLNLQHHYSKNQPWNCDMSLIKLNNARFILDANTYQVYKTLNTLGEPKWSTVDPDILFYISGNQFRKLNVRTDADTLIHTFAQEIFLGPWEGNISIGDRYAVFLSSANDVIVYDIVADQILASKKTTDIGSFSQPDWASISQSGNYVVINWRQPGTQGGVTSYDRNLNKVADLFTRGEHGDIGYDAFGNEVYVQMCPMEMSRLDNGQITAIMSGAHNCGHLSMRAYDRPGWATISGFGEVISLKLDGQSTVQRFAHDRSTGSNYDSQPKGVVSPDGSRVMWNSDWHGTSTVYAYVAEVPSPSDATAPAAPINLQIQ